MDLDQWPERPWISCDSDSLDGSGQPIAVRPPDSNRAAWIETEIETAKRLLGSLRALAENDKRLVKESGQPARSAADLMARNAARLMKYERYIEECYARLRAMAN